MSSEYVGCKDLLLPAAMCDGLAYPDNASAYVSNLASLGLIDIERNDAMKDEQAYAELEEHWRTKLPRSNPADAAQLLKFRRGVLTLTDFGVLFINACHEAK